ncbi:MAG: arginine repressor [Candidatus Borkfalkiaceae bacterium]|nr:arginine repressor [Christensenellaceae bacterium]
MDKNVRQNKIVEIITTTEVETQEELADLLNGYNFNVTQATVSRDIKELGLVKILGKTKKYRYAVEKESGEINSEKLLNVFKNCVLSIERAQNLVVLKTISGSGNSAGLIVDKLRLSEIVGSIAGDDTLLVVTHNEEDASVVVEKLKKLL